MTSVITSFQSELGGPRLTIEEFRLFQDLVHREAGIHLADTKMALLVSRLAGRLRALGIESFRAYHRHVTRIDKAELIHTLDCITTNETRLFREPQQFEMLEKSIIPAFKASALAGRRPRRIRVWSAACSTGEEPYSLAMTLLSHFPRESGWTIEILASDISTRVLARAREGVWPAARCLEIPERFRRRFLTSGPDGSVAAGQDIRSLVKFARINLSLESYPVEGPFDLIFCRNVLIYFSTAKKEHVIRQLKQRLGTDGCLFLGHAESILGMSVDLRRVGPTIYERAA